MYTVYGYNGSGIRMVGRYHSWEEWNEVAVALAKLVRAGKISGKNVRMYHGGKRIAFVAQARRS